MAGHAWREEPLGVGLRGIASALGRGRALGLLVSRVLGLLVSLVLDLACWCLQNSDPELSAIYCGSWQFGRVSQSFLGFRRLQFLRLQLQVLRLRLRLQTLRGWKLGTTRRKNRRRTVWEWCRRRAIALHLYAYILVGTLLYIKRLKDGETQTRADRSRVLMDHSR